ncbi:MAG TPA: cytochrome c biogenesis CcdA family protein [Ilumatobacteraceae bacterium]|nr:cytochrome c biogenesis CcdA family protein [Ilumatobacteraceae bacterium]
MSDVTLLVAFAAGTLALLSPCSALLLPSFFAYAFTSPTRLVARTAVFYLGLASVLVPLGVGSRLASSLVYEHRAALIAVAGWLIIVLGIVQILGRGFRLPFSTKLQQTSSSMANRRGTGSTFVLGAVYGIAGFCAGPVLGAILTMAATSANPVSGGLLLATYALGMAVPLFVLAAFWDRFDLGRRRLLRGRPIRLGPIETHSTSLIAGSMFVIIGILFLRFDGMIGLSGALGFADTTDTEFRAQRWLTDTLDVVPVWLVPAAVAVAAAAIAWRRVRRRSEPDDPSHDTESALRRQTQDAR